MYAVLYHWWYGPDPAQQYRSVIAELENHFVQKDTKAKSERGVPNTPQ